jgi:hypothetical protein
MSEFKPIAIVGLNDKAAAQLRLYAHKPPSERINRITLDLNTVPDVFWRNIFIHEWSQKLRREVIAAGGIQPLPAFRGNPGPDMERQALMEENLRIDRALHDPRQTRTPSFHEATVSFGRDIAEFFGGVGPYVKRLRVVTALTNEAYPRDPRVIERDRKQAQAKEVEQRHRQEIEHVLAQVTEALQKGEGGD